ncbi:MAG: peroxiredoxin [Hyphomicrobiaceae bacterium]|jgi:peroxiredoxin
MLAIGTLAPDFSLPDVTTGQTVSLGDLGDYPALLVMFVCNHCPYVVHVREQLAALHRDYGDQGVVVIGINSNDADAYPDDNPERMKETAAAWAWSFPYLVDETQDVAKAYQAACTPDFFLFDGNRKLAYRGQLDDSRPGNDAPIDGHDLRAALDAVLAAVTIPDEKQRPSLGCNIKWKPNQEPKWFG